MKLTQEVKNTARKHKTPFLVFDLERVRQNFHQIEKGFKNVDVYYAMKANDHPRIIDVLIEEGCGFEISSLTELNLLLGKGVAPEKIICLNPIKNPEFLVELEQRGVHIMAIDSKDEIDKIARYAPNSELIIRLVVDNKDSDWPLTRKFGVDSPEALDLMLYAKEKNLKSIGLTFHVGSQCLNKHNWSNALYVCEGVWHQAAKHGINLSFLSLGGGLPIEHTKQIPNIEEVGEEVDKIIRENFKVENGTITLSIEPGRAMVGDAAIMVTKVVGKAMRGNESWVYIDAGVFNGLMETIENFQYEILTDSNDETKLTTIAGPSCDSVDIPFTDVQLPDVNVDDYVYIINAGAYTTVYAAPFNGFKVPEIYFEK